MRIDFGELVWSILPILVIGLVVTLLIAGANSIDQIVWGR
jgi:hypothetical protein